MCCIVLSWLCYWYTALTLCWFLLSLSRCLSHEQCTTDWFTVCSSHLGTPAALMPRRSSQKYGAEEQKQKSCMFLSQCRQALDCEAPLILFCLHVCVSLLIYPPSLSIPVSPCISLSMCVARVFCVCACAFSGVWDLESSSVSPDVWPKSRHGARCR